jgi:hypothetical protein
MAELSQVDLGRPIMVRPVLATDERRGLAVQVVALVHYEAGLRLDVEVRPTPGTPQPGHFARIVVTDDVGTSYRASGQGSGGTNPARYDVRAIPAPPVAATALTIRFDSFADPFPGATRSTAGPWTISVPLSPST